MDDDQKRQQENIKAQSDANVQAQQAAAQAEIQKQQAIMQMNAQMEQIKTDSKTKIITHEANVKKQLMDHEFQINMQLKQVDLETVSKKEKEKEDRKDDRTRIQASQQSELIEQRKAGTPPKNFESSGNDILGGGMGLSDFGPR